MRHSRSDLDRLFRAADDARWKEMSGPKTPAFLEATAWMWAARYMRDGYENDRLIAESYCGEYLRDLKADRARLRSG